MDVLMKEGVINKLLQQISICTCRIVRKRTFCDVRLPCDMPNSSSPCTSENKLRRETSDFNCIKNNRDILFQCVENGGWTTSAKKRVKVKEKANRSDSDPKQNIYNLVGDYGSVANKSFCRKNYVEMKGTIAQKSDTKVSNLDHGSEKYKKKESDVSFSGDNGNQPHRLNEVGVQMLSASLRQQIFGENCKTQKSSFEQVTAAREELKRHGLLRSTQTLVEDIDLRLPRLYGTNVEEHFKVLGKEQSAPYRSLLQSLLEQPLQPPPSKWELRPGWTKYQTNASAHSVPFPSCDALVLDVEVCCEAGAAPTLACAASPSAWYCWVSPRLVSENHKVGPPLRYTIDDFLPLESLPVQRGYNLPPTLQRPRVVVGHNVSYDRARVREQYWLESTGTRFVDTMSLHVCVSGITSYQRAVLRSAGSAEPEDESWRKVASLNSLSEVHRLYCGASLEKEVRDVFVKGSLTEVREKFQEVASYCARDVEATHRVLMRLLPLFFERFPHPVTFAGMLELSSAYLPVGNAWPRFLSLAEQSYSELRSEERFLLARRADEACRLLHNENYRNDPWMWDADWTCEELRLNKNKRTRSKNTEEDAEFEEWPDKFRDIVDTRHRLPSRRPLLPGYPAWYRRMCVRPGAENWTPEPQNISTGLQITPKLLRLTWESYPLHYVREHGWGFLVPCVDEPSEDSEGEPKPPVPEIQARCPQVSLEPVSDTSEIEMGLNAQVEEILGWAKTRRRSPGADAAPENPSWYRGSGMWSGVKIGGCWFLKLPHKDEGQNVGNPLGKDFLVKFSEGVLTGEGEDARRVLEIGHQLSYWRNNRERVLRQLVGWLPSRDVPPKIRRAGGLREFGAIVPQIVTCGTLTRRAVEPTWMTASNAQRGRLGSELRAMIHAPPGFRLVGADVDSQELWIAAVLGDADFAGIHGCTPFGWMTLSGTKADGTDLHSVTASAVGISREHAKIINYARIYGAGPAFAERLLRRFNPAMSENESRAKAKRMFAITKGRKLFYPKDDIEDIAKRPVSLYEARKIASALGSGLSEVFHPPRWEGGTESAMFNRLEEIAGAREPVTPFLGGRLTRSLEAIPDGDGRFLTTRVNWVVQSGAVDFLHLMLVCMRWLQPRARFCLSFHDEVRYMVPEEQRYSTALALHVTNLLARAFCARRLGLTDLPQSVAFFASVEVDGALRKEAHMDCVTPSNPHGLTRGYGVPPGESLDIKETMRHTGHILRVPS